MVVVKGMWDHGWVYRQFRRSNYIRETLRNVVHSKGNNEKAAHPAHLETKTSVSAPTPIAVQNADRYTS